MLPDDIKKITCNIDFGIETVIELYFLMNLSKLNLV